MDVSLRSDLLDAAMALRARVLAGLVSDPDLRHVARYEHDLIVDKLQLGKPFRLTRGELPTTHPAYERGVDGTVLVLVGDDELRAA